MYKLKTENKWKQEWVNYFEQQGKEVNKQ